MRIRCLNVRITFSSEGFRVSDQPDVLNGSAGGEDLSELLVSHRKGQIADEDGVLVIKLNYGGTCFLKPWSTLRC